MSDTGCQCAQLVSQLRSAVEELKAALREERARNAAAARSTGVSTAGSPGETTPPPPIIAVEAVCAPPRAAASPVAQMLDDDGSHSAASSLSASPLRPPHGKRNTNFAYRAPNEFACQVGLAFFSEVATQTLAADTMRPEGHHAGSSARRVSVAAAPEALAVRQERPSKPSVSPQRSTHAAAGRVPSTSPSNGATRTATGAASGSSPPRVGRSPSAKATPDRGILGMSPKHLAATLPAASRASSSQPAAGTNVPHRTRSTDASTASKQAPSARQPTAKFAGRGQPVTSGESAVATTAAVPTASRTVSPSQPTRVPIHAVTRAAAASRASGGRPVSAASGTAITVLHPKPIVDRRFSSNSQARSAASTSGVSTTAGRSASPQSSVAHPPPIRTELAAIQAQLSSMSDALARDQSAYVTSGRAGASHAT